MYFIETLSDAPDAAWTRCGSVATIDDALYRAVALSRALPTPGVRIRVVGSPRYDGTPGVWDVAYPGPRGTETEPVRVWAVRGEDE